MFDFRSVSDVFLATEFKYDKQNGKFTKILTARAISKFWNYMKNQNSKILTYGVYEMLNDERIPNLVSQFKPDNIWPSSWPKNGRKGAKITKITDLALFLPFLAKKRVKCYPI